MCAQEWHLSLYPTFRCDCLLWRKSRESSHCCGEQGILTSKRLRKNNLHMLWQQSSIHVNPPKSFRRNGLLSGPQSNYSVEIQFPVKRAKFQANTHHTLWYWNIAPKIDFISHCSSSRNLQRNVQLAVSDKVILTRNGKSHPCCASKTDVKHLGFLQTKP
jgi:hypothetical protein